MKTILLCLALLCSFGFGCSAPETDNGIEHAADAGMQCSATLTVYTVGLENAVAAVQKRLPWQSDMAAYALSFALPNTDVQYDVRITGKNAFVDICRFPVYTGAEAEKAAITAVVNTMLSYPGVEKVLLQFDGQVLNALPCGTKLADEFNAFIE